MSGGLTTSYPWCKTFHAWESTNAVDNRIIFLMRPMHTSRVPHGWSSGGGCGDRWTVKGYINQVLIHCVTKWWLNLITPFAVIRCGRVCALSLLLRILDFSFILLVSIGVINLVGYLIWTFCGGPLCEDLNVKVEVCLRGFSGSCQTGCESRRKWWSDWWELLVALWQLMSQSICLRDFPCAFFNSSPTQSYLHFFKSARQKTGISLFWCFTSAKYLLAVVDNQLLWTGSKNIV